MTEFNKVTASCTVVEEAPPSGKKKVELVADSLSWLDQPPFIAPYRPRFEVTLENLYSLPLEAACGLWWPWWWTEGGWNAITIDGFATETFELYCQIPAEQGLFGTALHLYPPIQYLLGLNMECVQNPDSLVPIGSPPEFSDWTGLKEFPAPLSQHSPLIEFLAIRLPMLSSSKSTEGEIEIRLLSPADCSDWSGYLGHYTGEMRLGTTQMGCYFGPEQEEDYQYEIRYGYDYKGEWGTWFDCPPVKLTKNDVSDIFTIPLVFPKSGEPLGSKQPLYLMVMLRKGIDKYYFLWGPDINRFLLKPMVGYMNVGS